MEEMETFYGKNAMSSQDEEFKESVNYMLLKYIYVLQSKLKLKELQDKITISDDERLDCKFKKTFEILNKEEQMIFMLLKQKDEKVLEILETLNDGIQGYYITKDNVPVADFFYSLDLRDYKYMRPFFSYDNAFVNCLMIDYVNCKTIIESLNLDI